MVTVRQVDASFLETYDRIPMRVPVRCVYRLEKVDRGLGGSVRSVGYPGGGFP